MSKAEDKKVEDQDIAKLSDEEIQEALEEGKKLVQEDDLLDDAAMLDDAFGGPRGRASPQFRS